MRYSLRQTRFPFPLSMASSGKSTASQLAHQISDYLLPRYRDLDAPLLAVVGRPTGSGKSLLVNSLLEENVAQSTAIRPTTRQPLLVHHPGDQKWFETPRILPDFRRVDSPHLGEDVLELSASNALPKGLALLDSPDIDSVVRRNQELARQLLSAADLWIFVTTAARYADAVPWTLLREAAGRNIVLAVVLNRVPAGVEEEVSADLKRRMEAEGLASVPLFPIPEATNTAGFIPPAHLVGIEQWMRTLAHDANSRAAVVRQTLSGATAALLRRRGEVLDALKQQAQMRHDMAQEVQERFSQAEESVAEAVESGQLLRSEVLLRWQEVVGSGEWMQRIEGGVTSLRDRVTGWFRPRTNPAELVVVGEAIEDSLTQSLVAAAEDAIAAVSQSWGQTAGSTIALPQVHLRSYDDRVRAAEQTVRQWQREILELVSTTGQDKKITARALAAGVNLVGAALIIAIFASTAGLTGAEFAVAGGTALAAQRILEAVFGDDAIRKMAREGQQSFLALTDAFLEVDAESFENALREFDVTDAHVADLQRAFDSVQSALNERP